MNDKKNLNPFRQPDYRRWFLAETFSECSASMGLAITLVLVQVTSSISVAGVIGGVSSAVALAATLLGGAWGDAYDRRRLLQGAGTVSLAVNLVLACVLFLGDFPGAAVAVAALCVLVQAAVSFCDPVVDASLKQIITPEQFPAR
ncbi:MFS transporter [Corynebacterium oculi]|uniref:Enterobactin exporter EntS n=1 Tax=Corynebacterium oculi TaxID=1544416 RepID=A0A0Q0TYT6_9CORY|nr:MFS transporter [Corynebacterium oculi]KQB84345.1 hypothetical protein Cocul_01142 [Corynebacterium oculi]